MAISPRKTLCGGPSRPGASVCFLEVRVVKIIRLLIPSRTFFMINCGHAMGKL